MLATAFLTVSSAAQASYDPVGSGTARLSLDPSFRHLLVSHAVDLAAVSPARGNISSCDFTLPVSEGSLDPTLGKGDIDTSGILVFRRGRLGVPLRHLTVKTNPTPLIAKVGGGQLKIATSARRSFARRGFGSNFTAKGLRLTAKLATRLDKKLRLPDVFAQGQLLGNLSTTVQPATTAVLPSGHATLTPDPAMLAKLNSLFVSVNPIAPAELAPGPTFNLPFIPAGTIAPDGRAGTIRSGGSLEFLQLGAGQIFWHELWFDVGQGSVLAEVDEEPTPTFPGKLGQIPVTSLDLAPAANSSDPNARTITISGAQLKLSSQTAAAFEEAFAKPQERSNLFHQGELFGAVSFVAQGQ